MGVLRRCQPLLQLLRLGTNYVLQAGGETRGLTGSDPKDRLCIGASVWFVYLANLCKISFYFPQTSCVSVCKHDFKEVLFVKQWRRTRKFPLALKEAGGREHRRETCLVKRVFTTTHFLFLSRLTPSSLLATAKGSNSKCIFFFDLYVSETGLK